LFSSASGRRPDLPDSIRRDIIDQCQAARRKRRLLECVVLVQTNAGLFLGGRFMLLQLILPPSLASRAWQEHCNWSPGTESVLQVLCERTFISRLSAVGTSLVPTPLQGPKMASY